MCAVFNSLGSASAFILLTSLLVSSAVNDVVIPQPCKHKWGPVRQYPEDRDAVWLLSDFCELEEINESDIIGLPNTRKISFPYNDITYVDLAVFRHVPTLETLYLCTNKVRELSAFTEHSCPRLTELDLSGNQLTTLADAGTFSECTHLQNLNLCYNQMSYIHPDVFSSLTELEILHLSNNKLSFIPDRMLQNNKKLRTLWLDYNRLTYLPQDFASSFKRAGGGLIFFLFFDNPWSCACLLELLADVERAGVRDYDHWHIYEGTRAECVYSGAAPCYRHPPSGLLPPSRAVAGGGR